ncbi:MAG: flagellar motor switch protein FliM [Proteobacteria bacterium]|nr:flagellar motor switch protein FliM [Pseudomonadota bacterium]
MSDTGSKEDVLSTEEIDALVERTQTPEFDDGESRTHDFAGGPRLAMAKCSELTILTEKQAEALTTTLSSEYGLKISVDVGSLSYGVARDLHAALPERLCLVSTLAEPFDSEMHLLLPGSLLTTLVNHYFGGNSLPVPQMRSRVTPSEQRIGERVSKNFFRVMAGIWSDRLSLEFGDLFIDITPDRFAMIPTTTGFSIFSFNLNLGDDESHQVSLFVPFDGLETNAEALSPKLRKEPVKEQRSDWQPEMQAVLPEIPVIVSGQLCQVSATLRTLLNMEVGTTLTIPEPANLSLYLEGEKIAKGRYGAFDGFKAMQFISFEGEKL